LRGRGLTSAFAGSMPPRGRSKPFARSLAVAFRYNGRLTFGR
jgi:hypothetical protein